MLCSVIALLVFNSLLSSNQLIVEEDWNVSEIKFKEIDTDLANEGAFSNICLWLSPVSRSGNSFFECCLKKIPKLPVQNDQTSR